MAFSGRTRIAVAVAAGVTALTTGGAAFADPDPVRTELQITSGHQTVADTAGGTDCPHDSGAARTAVDQR